jgi:hypothetical protein
MTPDQRFQALRTGEQAAEYYETWPFQAARDSIMQAWSRAETTEAREALWFEYQALARVSGRLLVAGQNAKVAAIEIKQDEQSQTVKEVDPYAHA